MSIEDIKQIIENNKNDIAFIIGNGINCYKNKDTFMSWDNLIIKLWEKVLSETVNQFPKGISLTELYDILELRNNQKLKLQKEVAKLLEDSQSQTINHYHVIVNKIKSLNAPILTTNFDETFAKTFEFKLFKTTKEDFTDYYPWTTYHGVNLLNLPTDGFGIWYINGMIKYHRSIRLGLSHYMGSVERARNLLHKNKEDRLFAGKDINNWRGNKTWLNLVFSKSLFVFGLGLNENEVFLRWLLIERFKYFKSFPQREHQAWYITKKSDGDTKQGRKFFLKSLGFNIIEVDEYEDIYENIWM